MKHKQKQVFVTRRHIIIAIAAAPRAYCCRASSAGRPRWHARDLADHLALLSERAVVTRNGRRSMTTNLLGAALFIFAVVVSSACTMKSDWHCEVRRYGNRVVVNECHRLGY
jgi:hypothetical protein